jgi:hypothetical protein
MSVPILTIPESAYDVSAYLAAGQTRKRSQLFVYLVKLTHGSAIALTLAYLVGYFGLRPLLETTAARRLELLEFYRGKLRDCYLKLVEKVTYIPIVAINKNDGSGKLYADAVCQTPQSHISKNTKTDEELEVERNKNDRLRQDKLTSKLNQLLSRLLDCHAYQVGEMPHYKLVLNLVKEFQSKSDLDMFDDLFIGQVENKTTGTMRRKNYVLEVTNEIRSIKGLYMSGQI